MSRPIDSLSLYFELCDLAAEAGAVDTVIGRPEVLVRRLTTLRDLVGSMAHDVPIHASKAAADILAERHRQIEGEGWTQEHDDEHDDGDLGAAAACYALAATDALNPHSQGDGNYSEPPPMWPMGWDPSWWRPAESRRMLVKAGALILAEIERLDRAAKKAVTA